MKNAAAVLGIAAAIAWSPPGRSEPYVPGPRTREEKKRIEARRRKRDAAKAARKAQRKKARS